MISVANVPITIAEIGETVPATVEVYEIFGCGTVLKIEPQSPIDCSSNSSNNYLVQIGKHNIYTYGVIENSHILRFIQSDISFFSVEAWEIILKDEVDKTHSARKYHDRRKKLLKDLNKYFKSDECTISYRDANRIEEIICDVLKGE